MLCVGVMGIAKSTSFRGNGSGFAEGAGDLTEPGLA